MGWLPEKVSQYFDSVCYGAVSLLPEARQANRPFLIGVFEALQQEKHLTSADIDHLETLMMLAERLQLPEWKDPRSLIESEVYLMRRFPEFLPKKLRYCLEYLYYLLSRHGRIVLNPKASIWFLIWRKVQRFPEREQPIVCDFIGWMLKNQFSPASIRDRVRELYGFSAWVDTQGLNSLDGLSESLALKYLHERGQSCKANTHQKIGVHLQAFCDYYRERVDGRLPVFSLSRSHADSGHGMDANSEEVQTLWNALKGGALPAEPALMLVFVLGLGLPIKVLPLLRRTEISGKLAYEFQRPNRQGIQECSVSLPLEESWLAAYWGAYLKWRSAPEGFGYLFVSRAAIKKRQPVSSEYCRRLLQGLVAEVLGYPITVNRLERGSLRALAGRLDYGKFMERVQNVPLSNRTKLFIWLQRQNKPKGLTKPRHYPDKPKVKVSRGKGAVNPSSFLKEDRCHPLFLTTAK